MIKPLIYVKNKSYLITVFTKVSLKTDIKELSLNKKKIYFELYRTILTL